MADLRSLLVALSGAGQAMAERTEIERAARIREAIEEARLQRQIQLEEAREGRAADRAQTEQSESLARDLRLAEQLFRGLVTSRRPRKAGPGPVDRLIGLIEEGGFTEEDLPLVGELQERMKESRQEGKVKRQFKAQAKAFAKGPSVSTQITEANGRRLLVDKNTGEVIRDLGVAKVRKGSESPKRIKPEDALKRIDELVEELIFNWIEQKGELNDVETSQQFRSRFPELYQKMRSFAEKQVLEDIPEDLRPLGFKTPLSTLDANTE